MYNSAMKAFIFSIALLFVACQVADDDTPPDAAPPAPDAVVETIDATISVSDASTDFCIESCCSVVTGDLSCCPDGETCCATGPCPGP